MTGYQMTATIEALERAGISLEGFTLLRSKPELAAKTARLVNNEILGSTKLDNQLLSLLDDSNFFGPSDWLRYYNVEMIGTELSIPMNELEAALESPCPFVKDKKVKETHYLFCLPDGYGELPLTVNQWAEMYRLENKIMFREPFHYLAQNPKGRINYQKLNFSKEKRAPFVWYLMFKGVVPELCNKNFVNQAKFLKTCGYEIPMTVEIIPMLMLILEENKSLVDEENSITNVRTADKISGSKRVVIGIKDGEVFIYDGPQRGIFCDRDDDIADPNLGVFGYKKIFK